MHFEIVDVFVSLINRFLKPRVVIGFGCDDGSLYEYYYKCNGQENDVGGRGGEERVRCLKLRWCVVDRWRVCE